MKRKGLLLLVGAFALITMACNSSLVQGGSCYDKAGDKVTHVWDAVGDKWQIKKVEGDVFGQTLTYCGVDRKAAAYVDTNRELSVLSFFDEPRYLTDESEEQKYALEGRHEGLYYFTVTGPYGLEWY